MWAAVTLAGSAAFCGLSWFLMCISAYVGLLVLDVAACAGYAASAVWSARHGYTGAACILGVLAAGSAALAMKWAYYSVRRRHVRRPGLPR